MNYRCINPLSAIRKIYTGILEDRVHRMTEDLDDYMQGGFRIKNGCVNQIFALKQEGEKA